MIPRGQLEIDWAWLLTACGLTFRAHRSGELCFPAVLLPAGTDAHQQQDGSTVRSSSLVCLSVRSALDVVLSEVAWPAGSEVLMSVVNLPAMAEIIASHGFVPVGVDVSPETLGPDPAEVAACITPQTRALLIAHLFGSRLPMEPYLALARSRGIELWEDLAQGYHDPQPAHSQMSDIRFFSFGLIKSPTTLGGGIAQFREAERAERCRELQQTFPQQSSAMYRRRVFRGMVLKALGQPVSYTMLSGLATLAGVDFDARLSQSVRGFRKGELLVQLRQRPSEALQQLLNRRLSDGKPLPPRWKEPLVAEYRRLLPPKCQMGLKACFPTHWVFPIRSSQPEELRRRLWKQGYDATTKGSQLRVIASSMAGARGAAPLASEWVPQLLYLPLHQVMTVRHVAKIAGIVADSL